jgi:uncharacterized membrane protein
MENKKYEYKFTEEEFNKLPILERIEYRQREDRIKKHYDVSIALSFFWTCIAIMGFIMILIVAGYGSIGKEFAYNLFYVLYVFIIVFFVGYLVCIVIDQVIYEFEKKELKALKDSYFNFKVEVKKK